MFDSAGALQLSWSIPNVSGFLATAPAAVPEPATWLMAVAGLAGMQLFCRRQRGIQKSQPWFPASTGR